tara:strand:- start:122 stop:523 length:402 start_codon:yes stop_codon:yes gene_type:complete
MREKIKKLIFGIFSFVFIFFTTLISFDKEALYALESDNSVLINKVSKSYTKKFCNAIGFGLSKESAMNFSFEENKQVFKKRKGVNDINKELLAEDIASSVIEQCGYPINLNGEKGILEFKNYYLSKDREYSEK